MTRHHVEIKTEGTRGQVLIDGHDIAKAVTNLSLRQASTSDVRR
jgi:hypothetical protein